MLEDTWTQNKIKGDIAESICKGHFELIDYNVDKIGIENIGHNYTNNFLKNNNQAFTDTLLKNNLNKMPDLLLSRVDGKSFMMEVKFRTNISSFNLLQNEFYWTYRRMIYTGEYIKRLSSEIQEKWSDDKLYEDISKRHLIEEMIRKANKSDLRLPIYFYVVCRKHEKLQNDKHIYVHLNYVERPGFVPIGHSMFSSYNHYKSTNKSKNLNSVYFEEILPLLDEVLS